MIIDRENHKHTTIVILQRNTLQHFLFVVEYKMGLIVFNDNTAPFLGPNKIILVTILCIEK